MSAIDWIGDLIRWFGQLIPRWDLVKSTQGAVRFGRGGRATAVGPGIVWWWPAAQELMTYPVVRSTEDLPTQHLTTKDEKTISLSLVIVFEIVDIKAALTKQWDLEDTIQDIGLLCAQETVRTHTFQQLLAEWPACRQAMLEEMRKSLRVFGVRILKLGLETFAHSKVVAVVGEGAGGAIVPDSGNEEDDD